VSDKPAKPPEWIRPLGWATLGICAALALIRALSASQPPPPRRLSEVERQRVGRAAAAEEPAWRKTSVHDFPEDSWSQDDDFSASERKWAIDQANREGVPVMEIYRAIDEDLHAHPPEPPAKSSASPCRPRTSYD
jgi:hypothetical protein